MELWSDFLQNNQRLVDKWKHYFIAYERHFLRFRGRDVTMIEIGCGNGGSAQMWKRYFGPNARIFSLDIRESCKKYAEDQIEVMIGDQSDADFLSRVIEKTGTPDIVLDDGSHVMSHITASFNFLYPKVAKDGVYAVEDLHTAYWPKFEGGLRKEGSFIEYAKNLIDELNAIHTNGEITDTVFHQFTQSIHFYDSMIFFEKGRHTKKQAFRIGLP